MSRVTTASLSIALQAIPRHVTGYDRITSLRSVGPKGQISLGIAITSLRYVKTKDKSQLIVINTLLFSIINLLTVNFLIICETKIKRLIKK